MNRLEKHEVYYVDPNFFDHAGITIKD